MGGREREGREERKEGDKGGREEGRRKRGKGGREGGSDYSH